MAGQRTLASTLTAALAVETLGAVAPWSGGATLPSPRVYAATWTLWFVLGIVAGTGAAAARAAGQLSILVLLTQLALGQGGRKLVAALSSIGANYGTPPAPAAAPQVQHA